MATKLQIPVSDISYHVTNDNDFSIENIEYWAKACIRNIRIEPSINEVETIFRETHTENDVKWMKSNVVATDSLKFDTETFGIYRWVTITITEHYIDPAGDYLYTMDVRESVS